MAGETIDITFEQVLSTADTIRETNKTLAEKLEAIRTEFNNLAADWDSDASISIRNKINGLQPRFQNYWDVVDSYQKFLVETVQKYNDKETIINNNANAFK